MNEFWECFFFLGSGEVRNAVLGSGGSAETGETRAGAGLRAASLRHAGEDAETRRGCQNVGQISRRRRKAARETRQTGE